MTTSETQNSNEQGAPPEPPSGHSERREPDEPTPQSKKACRWCKSMINNEAKYCHICNQWQSRFKNWIRPSTSVSLIAALAAWLAVLQTIPDDDTVILKARNALYIAEFRVNFCVQVLENSRWYGTLPERYLPDGCKLIDIAELQDAADRAIVEITDHKKRGELSSYAKILRDEWKKITKIITINSE